MKPLLIKNTPAGKEPLTVNPGVPVEFDETTIPFAMVASTISAVFHPAFMARVLKFALVVSAEIVKLNVFVLP
jgi:hypothetical protein